MGPHGMGAVIPMESRPTDVEVRAVQKHARGVGKWGWGLPRNSNLMLAPTGSHIPWKPARWGFGPGKVEAPTPVNKAQAA